MKKAAQPHPVNRSRGPAAACLPAKEGQGTDHRSALPGSVAPESLGRTDLVALLGLAALTLVFFWKIALTNRVLAGLDVFAYFYPYRDFVSAALRAGRLPLWNPHLFMGAPLLANSQAAVLYPFHWPLIWLSTPKQIAWSIVLHVWLAGAGSYLFARIALRLRAAFALVAAFIFALGGFVGAQVEHVNQLNASAWLPWLLLCLEGTMTRGSRRLLALLGGSAVVSIAFLAGHTQAAYIVFFGAAVYALCRGWWDPVGRKWRTALQAVAMLVLMIALGVALSAGQLLPTLELSRLSVRSGGLPYNEAAAFSLKPTLVFKAFLPPLLWDPPFSEYVAYVGLAGMVLAGAGAWTVLRERDPARAGTPSLAQGRALLVLALAGVFLAFGAYNPAYYVLYKTVPGFSLFRAPARWLLLYSFGAAALAAIGGTALVGLRSQWERSTHWREWALALLVVGGLFLTSRKLAYNKPTTPTAFDSLRTAPAHLLADQEASQGATPQRFLSLSDIAYDPGDLEDLQAMYRQELPEEAVYDLIVASKMKEVLAFNLPLRYRLYSVDGYDGGLLPLASYVDLERLFLAEEEIWPDGRLRQQLRRIPPTRLLSLLNVKHVITDKTQDVWIDDVFYDLEHTVPLGRVALTDLPAHPTTGIGVVSFLTDTVEVPDGYPVAQVVITPTQGSPETLTLRAGEHTSEGLYSAQPVSHRQARIGHQWRDEQPGSDYIATFALAQPQQPVAISVQSLLPDHHVQLRGLSLIDENSGTSRNLTIDPAYRLVHSGDVKIYENLNVLPRAFLIPEARTIPDNEQALQILRDPAFSPEKEVVLASDEGASGDVGHSEVNILAYEPEEVRLSAKLEQPANLILTDTLYPGWIAEVDGKEVPILRADLYFRAIRLEAGDHLVTFKFSPIGVHLGLTIGLASWLFWLAAAATIAIHTGRKTTSEV